MSRWSELEKRVTRLETIVADRRKGKGDDCSAAILKYLGEGRQPASSLIEDLRDMGFGKIMILTERAKLCREGKIMNSSENYKWYWELVD